jgi:hypothetical protein
MTRDRVAGRLAVAALGVTALLSTQLALAASAPAAAVPAVNHAAAHGLSDGVVDPITPRQVAFHDEMRVLWTDHVVWTRLAIVTFAASTAGFDTTAARLLQNQVDIGDAFKPFYGETTGNQLTALLREHILIAVQILQAAKAGDAGALEAARVRWYANADDIARLLAAINLRSWPFDTVRVAMRTHLDQTLTEATHELGGDYQASVADYEEIQQHILFMADLLSSGIVRQFPDRFR